MTKTNSKPTTIPDSTVITQTEIIFWLFSFLIPFFFGHQQLATGIAVNLLLFLSAIKLKRSSQLPVVVLPSIAAFTRGIIFGPQTFFLLYFLPIIWFGNLLLVRIFQLESSVSKTIARLLLSIAAKTSVLYVFAIIYHAFNLVPKPFLTAMGIMQFVTAAVAGTITVVIFQKKYIHE